MSSSQAQRQERLQARLRGAGTSGFSGGFSFGFTLPQEPSPPREPTPPPPELTTELSPPPPPLPQEPTPRRAAPKQTPPTRASPRFSTGPVETPAQRSTRSSSRLSDAASRLQQSAQSSAGRSTGQKRKQDDITQDEIPLQRASITTTTLGSNTLSTLLSSPAGVVGPIAPVTPQTRGQRRRQPSPDKFLTPGDGVATRLFGMESGARSNGFISPTRGNAFRGLQDEAEEGDEDEDEVLLNTESLVGEILENLAEEEEQEGNNTIMENRLEELDEEEGEEEDGNEDNQEEYDEESPLKPVRTPGRTKRRRVIPAAPSEEEAELEEGLAEEAEEDGSAEPNPTPTPRPHNKAPKPPPPPQKASSSKPSKPSPPPRRRETIEIIVHRLSKPKFTSYPQPKQKPTIPAINPLDVLSQIFKEMLKKQYEKLDSPIAKLALEVFADEVEVRLLEHTDTLHTTLQAAKELRRYQKAKQNKREELMALRMELGKVEGEIDEVRRRFEKDNRESKSKHSISQRLETIAASLDLRRAHISANPSASTNLEGSVDLLLRKLSSKVISRRCRFKPEDELEGLEDDEDMDEIFEEEMGGGGDGLETGSILERVRGFNRFLERAEKVIKEAHARKAGEGR
ncbi:hypothetical protein EV426DRAFT_172517 [Tirmania nivea]|nr:hypothetical protein EV426DRAFT_172517 [Tirmania nivea]